MQDVEIAQLKYQVQALQQECKEWQNKHQDAKQEVCRISGSSSKQNRRVKQLEDECANVRSQVVKKDDETKRLRNDVLKATRRSLGKLQSGPAETSSQRSSRPLLSHTAHEDLEAARSQIADLQRENLQLRKLHAKSNCEEFMLIATQQVADAQQLQQAAEAENKANCHLRNGIELIKQENSSTHDLLNEATREIRQKEAEIQQLEHSVEVHSGSALTAQNTIASLRTELLQWKPQAHGVDFDLSDLLATTSDTSSVTVCSDRQPKALDELLAKLSYTDSGTNPCELPKQQLARIDTNLKSDKSLGPGIEANIIIININPAHQKNWNLLKRVQAVIIKASTLDIIGPADLVQDLIAAMSDTETDHAEATAAAAHWQKVALEALTEIDILREELIAIPACTVPSHKSLKDELEAKDMQLQMQAQLMAKWQQKMAGVKEAMDKASGEMRERGNMGIRAT